MSEQNLAQLLNESKFEEAHNRLKFGEKLPKTILDHQKSQIFDQLFKNRQYEIINHLINDKTIETDVYEFDHFDKSIFQNLLRSLKSDEESDDFFKELISHFENISDEVATQTLLTYFIEKLAPLAWVKILVDAGCDVRFKNNAEENLIHLIIKNNERRFDLNENDLNELKQSYIAYFVDEGLDINESNIVGQTPLIAAVKANKKDLIPFLMENGADANHTDKDGNSAFFYAVAHLQSESIYDILRSYSSADFSLTNKNGESLLFEYLRMMQGGDQAIGFLKKLIEDDADLYQVSKWYGADKTPIDLIAEKKAEILEAVLETGKIDVNRADNEGNTLLHKVCAFNVNYEADKAKETYRKVKLLLGEGADAGITNDKDQTALMLASDDNLKIKTVELLMKQS